MKAIHEPHVLDGSADDSSHVRVASAFDGVLFWFINRTSSVCCMRF